MEPIDNDKKKINEDLVVFMRKRSDHEAPRYTARLKTYVDFQRKRRRAAAARRPSEGGAVERKSSRKPKQDTEGDGKKDADLTGHAGSEDGRQSRRRGEPDEDKRIRAHSISRSHSYEPSDRCGRRRRRRRCGRRRRRRSRRRGRRRRRSCRGRRRRRRRSRRRRRRRSCRRGRRRRRRSRRRRRRRSCR